MLLRVYFYQVYRYYKDVCKFRGERYTQSYVGYTQSYCDILNHTHIYIVYIYKKTYKNIFI